MARTAPPQAPPQPARAAPASRRAAPLLQARLAIGPAHDRHEAEADRIADRILASGETAPRGAPPVITPVPAPRAQRAPIPSPPPSTAVSTRKIPEAEEEKEAPETKLQRRADGPAVASAAAEGAIARMRAGGGAALPSALRDSMEAGLGRPLSAVRVHDTPTAHGAAKAVGAQAFTVGNHVFFGAGRYRPETRGGRHLLAHELVHTQQQKGLGTAAQTMPLQRATEGEEEEAEVADPGTSFARPGNAGARIELDAARESGRISLPLLKVPRVGRAFKGTADNSLAPGVADPDFNPLPGSAPFIWRGKNPRGSTTARQSFLRAAFLQVAEQEVEPALQGHFGAVEGWENAADVTAGEDGPRRYYLRRKRGRTRDAASLIVGTEAELADHELIKLPDYDSAGNYHAFDVDHILPLLLGGLDGWENFWVFDRSANRSEGSKLNSYMEREINGVLDAARERNFFTGPNAGLATSYSAIKDMRAPWDVEFRALGALSVSGDPGVYWTRAQITAGAHLSLLKALTMDEVIAEGLVVRTDEAGRPVRPKVVSVFAKPGGGFRQRFKVTAQGVEPEGGGRAGFRGFGFQGATVTDSDPLEPPYIRRLEGEVFRLRDGAPLNPTPATGENGIPVLAADGLGFSGYIDQAALDARIRAVPKEATGMSPVTFLQTGISAEGEIFADGIITATRLLFPGLEVPFFIRGTDIFVEFPIPSDRLNLGPVTVTEAALQIGVGDAGFFLEGSAGVEVAALGSGQLTARVQRGTTILAGDFDFDLDFLDPAKASFAYDFGADTLTLGLEAGVKEGALPGVASGRVSATFSREGISVSGSLLLGGALSGTEVSVSYAPETGIALGAENIPLPVAAVPGVTSATASLFARQDPGTGEWSFGGGGEAVIGIAGVSGRVGVLVDGARVTITGGPLTVEKGPASGTLSFTATNAPLDEEGNPVEGAALDTFTVWGAGRAEITFGEVLHGAAAITLGPDASLRIEGSIGLPPSFEVFPERRFEKDLLHVETPDFPIWGVSLGGVGFGIFAFADADLGFNAFIGPGQLVDTEVTAAMDLDAPEDATVTGSARFLVPAGAGLTLDIGGGLRARAAVAYVQGRVGLDGELGIDAEASAGVDVAWSRQAGLTVAADVEAKARPKFRVGVNASVTAGVDLWVTDISKTWGPWRRTLGEFGPEMEMGIKVPVGWSETGGTDFSLEDIEITRPDISARDMLKSAFEELV
ncbi:DUF4157 domain-containing protein [Oceanicella sp. SM1341]|uniref:eCIS core domain-containing protein n=1 Tax=Oceanicella sp. SM1341 TaxID=1548889 RepID=UPI000E52B276|nr:DUF4157 domain-containing protein [Oceanicella sp. SM1341]